MTRSNKQQARPESAKKRPAYPAGVKLVRTISTGTGQLWSIAFGERGKMLATASDGGELKLWEVPSGKLVQSFDSWPCRSVAFSPGGGVLASGEDHGGRNDVVALWEPQSGRSIRTLKGHENWVISLAFDESGTLLASGSFDDTVKIWEARTGRLLHSLDGGISTVWSVAFNPQGSVLAGAGTGIRLWDPKTGLLLHSIDRTLTSSVAFHPQSEVLAGGSSSGSIALWDSTNGKLLRTLEGHTAKVSEIAFSPGGQLLASKSHDQTVRLWDCETWETVAVLPVPTHSDVWMAAGLAFHPTEPLLAAAAGVDCDLVHIWQLDVPALLSTPSNMLAEARAVHHSTAKIVLVGDHSVGKSALAYRLIHDTFKEQSSTHGQQFWVLPDLGARRADGTECEAILWDLAGQPDYRLVHALFLDNADLALVLFDASDLRDPLHGVGFWLKQLRPANRSCPIILVAAQVDRGTSSLTTDELSAFCRREVLAGPIATSAFTGEGFPELIEQMRSMIAWDNKAATVTTSTFKRIKDFVLGLKETPVADHSLVRADELRKRLEQIDPQWRFTDAEMMTAVGHLENYGYAKILKTSDGEDRILLQPELLNNLASSFVLEARRHPKGLGALEEKKLLAGGYDFSELRHLRREERDVLLDSATLLFLEHHVCFREIDPLRIEPYLVFPELINLKKPPGEEPIIEDGVAYTLIGPTENVFASLVVLLGYTHTFTRTAQWQGNARYEMGDGLVCSFRQEAERDGELDLVHSYGPNVGQPVRALFQGLFESFLARRNLTVLRYDPVRCPRPQCGQLLERSVVRQRLKEGKDFAFCNDCGEKLALPTMAEPIQLTREVQAEVEAQRRAADKRTCFEQALFRVRTYTAERSINPPETFISYARGVPEHERWVEKRLAVDLQKAGIEVLLDRWHNAQIGASVARFVERIERCDRVIVIGTPLYQRKYENREADKGYIVAAEVDVIANRLLGTEAQKESVLPVLLDGGAEGSLPPLLFRRVHADFRDDLAYFSTALELILSLYGLLNDPAIADLRDSLTLPAAADLS